MNTRLSDIWDTLRGSYWFVPTLMTLSSIVLAALLLSADLAIPNADLARTWFIFAGDADRQRSLLLAIAGLMAGLIGLVFSLTMASLTVAAAQFGPRLIRNVMRDVTTQVVLGTFVATFAYCIVVLLATPPVGVPDETPIFAVTISIVLAAISVVLLVFFIDHLAISIQAPNVVAEVSAELMVVLVRTFPLTPPPRTLGDTIAAATKHAQVQHDCVLVTAVGEGYIHAIDRNSLLELAQSADVVIESLVQPGDFVVRGAPIARYHPALAQTKTLDRAINISLILGERRTLTQDVLFGINSMVELAVRALSPAINDPITAMMCLDRLGAALIPIVERATDDPYCFDDTGHLRIIYPPLTFEQLTDAAFHLIRQYGSTNADVLIHLLTTVERVARRAHRGEDHQTLMLHARYAAEAAQTSIALDVDRKRVAQRYTTLVLALEPPTG